MRWQTVVSILVTGALGVGAIVAVTYQTDEERLAAEHREVNARHAKYLAKEAKIQREHDARAERSPSAGSVAPVMDATTYGRASAAEREAGMRESCAAVYCDEERIRALLAGAPANERAKLQAVERDARAQVERNRKSGFDAWRSFALDTQTALLARGIQIAFVKSLGGNKTTRTLHIVGRVCGPEFVDRLRKDLLGAAAAGLGFERVSCEKDAETWEAPLP